MPGHRRRWRPRPRANPRWHGPGGRPAGEGAARGAPPRQLAALRRGGRAPAGAAGRGAALRARLVDATSAIAEAALVDLDKRLRELLRQARLTHIDAVIGKKKRLEIEIANLAEGRYPAEMFAKLQLEGLIGDDEEYWPFEGEYWADEYENYK